MKRELRTILEAQYHEDVEWKDKNEREAEAARRAGNEEQYLELAVHTRLPDTCWALERWDEARQWYRHNARVLMERHAWHAKHPDPDYPLDGLLDWEAITLIKAGDLKQGRPHLEKAITHVRKEPDAELGLSELGLHAAQAGVNRLAKYAIEVDRAREELPGGKSKAGKTIRTLLRYEPAQVALLLGQWDTLQDHLKELAVAERLVDQHPGQAYPEPLERALVAAIQGLRATEELRQGAVAPKAGRDVARHAFGEAMLHFFEFGGRTDWNTYFMRLNCQLADDLADGREPNPNPFAE